MKMTVYKKISIHALREEGDLAGTFGNLMVVNISIHALREEGDYFTSCLPSPQKGISIHALREEGDGTGQGGMIMAHNFYPRPPRGGRPKLYVMYKTAHQFLSTPSARRATVTPGHRSAAHPDFYPRPPRGGRPHVFGRVRPHHQNFYPRPPRGGRQDVQMGEILAYIFLSTPSARRAT